VIVRWGLGELPGVLAELGAERPFLIASPRWHGFDLPIEPSGGWGEVPSHRIDEAAAEAQAAADSLLAVGGGSAIDLAKAISAATGLAVVSLPTTYAGAEWTTFFGVRDPDRRMKGGGAGARLGGVVYEPRLTLDLPRPETVGTALNALAHCAEALYVQGRNEESDREAPAGAALIGRALPRVVTDGHDLEARTALLEGAMHAGKALASAGLGLGHAMAQVLGGRYGLPHGAMNALCLPPALRFNQSVAAEEIGRFARALETDDPVARVEELARPGGFGRLQDHGVPENELDELAATVIARAGARANPRPATAEDVAGLLRSIW
jgi:maleylacetate reductase